MESKLFFGCKNEKKWRAEAYLEKETYAER
jgi:hypothetical protein